MYCCGVICFSAEICMALWLYPRDMHADMQEECAWSMTKEINYLNKKKVARHILGGFLRSSVFIDSKHLMRVGMLNICLQLLCKISVYKVI